MSRYGNLTDFLNLLHTNPGPDRLIEIRALPRDRRRAEPVHLWIWDTVTYAAVIRRALELNDAGYDIYVGVNPRNSMGGKIGNIAGVHALPIDIDVMKTGARAEDVVSRLRHGLDLMPSLGVWSGNGAHLYLTLDRLYPIVDATPVAKRLIYALEVSDAVHSPAQVMRLPGTWNLKPTPPEPCHLVFPHGPMHTLEGVVAALDAAGVPELKATAPLDDSTSQLGTPAADVAALVERLPLDFRLAVETGQAPAMWTDHSACDWALCCTLVALGGTDAQIRELYETYPVRKIKAIPAGGAYFERTLARARARVRADIETNSLGARLLSTGLFYKASNGDVLPDLEACRRAMHDAFWSSAVVPSDSRVN